jgi:uncharacterized DUF497 family protein
MRFEWDAAKAALNLKTHGISCDEAVEVFFDPNAVEGFDAQHSNDEDRFYIIGFFNSAVALCSLCRKITRRVVRIISARKAEGKKQKEYEER